MIVTKIKSGNKSLVFEEGVGQKHILIYGCKQPKNSNYKITIILFK